RSHHVDQVIQVGAMVDVGQKLAVHFFHARPIGAVQVGDVKIIALIAPAFVEDLAELFLGFEVHAKGDVQTAGAGLRSLTIRVDQEQLRSRPRGAAAATASSGSSGCGAIDELVAIGADVVGGDSGDEGRRTAVAQAETNQSASALADAR